MVKTSIILVLVIIFSVQCAAEKQQSPVVDMVDSMLWWLPENTETIIVARGPFSLTDSRTEPPNLSQALQHHSYELLADIQGGKFLQQIIGQTVLVSVEGSRKFRSPTALGLMPYEGCHILLFQPDFNSVRDSLVKALEAGAKETHEINGQRVMMFEEKLEADLWKLYVVLPQPDLLLLATDRSYLTEVLNRINLKKGGKRALPEDLPEWKYIDTSAQFWAVRHYDKDNAPNDPTSPLLGKPVAVNFPDPQAIGITFVYNPDTENTARIRYLSDNRDAKRIIGQMQLPNSQIKNIRPGVAEMAIFLANVNNAERDIPLYTLFWLAVFGHGIFI